MKATHSAYLLLLGLLAVAAGGWAGCAAPGPAVRQFPPAPTYPPDHEYALDELIELSVHRNPSLDVSRSLAESAQGLVDQVKALWLPAFRYDFAATAYNNDFSYRVRALHLATINVPITGAYNITNNLALTQIVSTGGKRTSGLKQAKMFAELLRVDVLRQQDLVACEVATFYQLVCLTNEIDAILDDALRRMRVFRQVAKGLNEHGSLRASGLDALEADLAIAELEQLQTALRAGRQHAYNALKKAIGLDPSEPLLLRQTSLPPPVTPLERLSVIAAVVKGFLHRPETREVDLFARISTEQVRFAKAAWAPNIAVFGNEIDITGNHATILNAIDGLIAGIVVDVPIYAPGQRARLRQALGLEQASLALQHEIEQLLTLEIDATALEAQRALATLAMAQRAREVAAEHEDATRQAYSRELIPASNVVTAIALNALSKAGYAQALFSYHNSRAKLKRAIADRETPYGY
jgi:outer membrane protein TolC